MSDRYPWAAEVLALLDAPPESVNVVGDGWYVDRDLRTVLVRPIPKGRANVHIESGGLLLAVHDVADVPTAVRALLAGLRATEAVLGGVEP